MAGSADDSTELPSHELDAFRAWVTERVSPTCPVCGTQNGWWTLGTRYHTASDGVALLHMSCQECGVMLFFNPGIVRPFGT